LLSIAVGCDLTGQYEKKFQETLQSVAQRAEFDARLHAAPTEVVDAARKNVGVKLRVPKFFDNNTKSLAASEPTAQPPLVALPGLSYAMERQLDDDAGKFLPVYVYFAAVPKSEQKTDALQNTLAAEAAKRVPGAKWEDAFLRTPTGQTITLKRIRVEGKQDFMDYQKKAAANTDGRFDLYLLDGGAHHVLIGWRAPKGQSQKYQFDAASDAAMGTVQLPPPSAPEGKAPAPAPPTGG